MKHKLMKVCFWCGRTTQVHGAQLRYKNHVDFGGKKCIAVGQPHRSRFDKPK